MPLEAAIVLLALAAAAATRPWRLLVARSASQAPEGPGGAPGGRQASPLLTPLLATLVFLPWIWALPTLHAMPLQLQMSGACLVVLMVGWPLAVPVLATVAVVAALLSPALTWSEALGLAAWQGVVPATLALLLGALLRRLTGTHLFVYVLGRAFLGTALCMFAAGGLALWSGHALPGVDPGLAMVARWLMAWGDAVVTGMLCAVFVAFRPEWLATWSDRLYLRS
ncbi:hypothetical protein QRO11_15820 [Paracidovorax citrulli]|uniref:Uncharacterized protein n=2 Tax=Paracidovorax citrulli TaxID=80869 RepID=A1TMI0_PARC0|nr:hypothetical protein [Paracidovorax citrulli]ABM32168.1 conserved hypothetical protein [Paracidovorax citrulli AAC00-1]ATG94816.1 hypothetical protein CQB05_12885 [Paracidovorax citrulli]PVY66357.1 putative membrane protein [Paracidovorax citrulli]QCX12089.1 hypothetical protein APS58_3321 [Paracidovorax citrulli]REG69471.1 putative membrane protein [Paracidovorax citrulli]